MFYTKNQVINIDIENICSMLSILCSKIYIFALNYIIISLHNLFIQLI